MKQPNIQFGGVYFTFILLKCCGLIDYEWKYVLIPLWVTIVVYLFFLFRVDKKDKV